MAQIIEMPKLSDTMTVGTLVKWLKKEGDAVKSGDMLAEVETDKATMELECFFDGTLIKIFAPGGSQVAVGAALCAVGKAGEKVDAPAPKDAPAAGGNEAPAKPAAEAQPAAEAKPAAESKPAAKSNAQIVEMPKLSDTMTTGKLVKWLKKEGDAVKSGDMLAEVETDKATMELECFFDGTLIKIFAPDGASVKIGDALCAIGKPGEKVDAPAPKSAAPEAKAAAAAPEAKTSAPAPAPQAASAAPAPSAAAAHAPAPATAGGRVKISPLAKKLATEKKIDPARVTGTGPGGRIVRADVLAAEKNGGASAGAPAAKSAGAAPGGPSLFNKGPIQEERTVPVSNMRGAIARRLVESKTQYPHFYVEIEIDAAPLMALREQLNTGLEKEGVKLSVNDFILKGCAEALRKVPQVNGSWEGNQIRFFAAAHVSFAVAIDDGLITPVIRDTHLKNVFQISTEAKSLGKLAKDKKLKPDQFTGGTFCVSNLGMMGIPRFSAIINPPNAAILAVGTTVTKPVVKNGQIVIGQTMILTLSCDHRVVDGAVGAQYLNALKSLLEAPALLLV